MLSATLSKDVNELVDVTMADHVYVDALDESIKSENDGDVYVIPETVKQQFLVTYVKHRLFTLSALIAERSRVNSKVLVFMASTQMVEFHHELFSKHLLKMPKSRDVARAKAGSFKGENVVVFDEDDIEEEEEIVLDTQIFKLHGSMDQKTRRGVFQEFRAASKGILLCTVSFLDFFLIIVFIFIVILQLTILKNVYLLRK